MFTAGIGSKECGGVALKQIPAGVRAFDADAKVRDSFFLLFANSPVLAASWGAFWGAPEGAPEAGSPMRIQCPARGSASLRLFALPLLTLTLPGDSKGTEAEGKESTKFLFPTGNRVPRLSMAVGTRHCACAWTDSSERCAGRPYRALDATRPCFGPPRAANVLDRGRNGKRVGKVRGFFSDVGRLALCRVAPRSCAAPLSTARTQINTPVAFDLWLTCHSRLAGPSRRGSILTACAGRLFGLGWFKCPEVKTEVQEAPRDVAVDAEQRKVAPSALPFFPHAFFTTFCSYHETVLMLAWHFLRLARLRGFVLLADVAFHAMQVYWTALCCGLRRADLNGENEEARAPSWLSISFARNISKWSMPFSNHAEHLRCLQRAIPLPFICRRLRCRFLKGVSFLSKSYMRHHAAVTQNDRRGIPWKFVKSEIEEVFPSPKTCRTGRTTARKLSVPTVKALLTSQTLTRVSRPFRHVRIK